MPTPPAQSVTTRYSANLLRSGANAEFELVSLIANQAKTDNGLPLGPFYTCTIRSKQHVQTLVVDDGATPLQALERALAKAGVTFR